MLYPLTITAAAMRDINRSAILEIIRRQSPISRTAIAQKLDVSLPTVMRIVDELIAEEFVRPHGSTEWSGGRRRTLLEFNAEGYVVLGVDMGGTQIYGAISDLGGHILGEVNGGYHSHDSEENFANLITLIDALLASPILRRRRVRGIGIGAPGVTLHKEGIIKWAYSLNWRDYPLKARLMKRYNLPVTVDNDVNLAAMGEYWFGAGQNCNNMILMAVGTGIGAGIIIDGILYRGANEASGEIGNMLPGHDFLGKNFQDFGALETIASGTGMENRARAILNAKRSPEELKKLVTDDIFDAARQGQKWAWTIINETVDYLAIAIINLVASFDPELIVIGGGIARSADLLMEPILHRVTGILPAMPRLVISDLGLQATVMGAVTNVLHNTGNFYQVRKLS